MKTNGKFKMDGSEGTGQYVVIAATARGRVGVRVLGGDPSKVSRIEMARVRVEPVEKTAVIKQMAEVLPDGKWKQPGQDGEHRFSRVVENGASKGKSLHIALAKALAAIGVGELKTEVNPDAPQWAKGLAAA